MKSLRASAALLGVIATLAGPLGTLSAQQLPADEPGSLDRLNASPRHGEWVTIDAGGGDMVRAWIS